MLLWTTGASILASIVGQVAVETARPSDSRRRDVRDQEIYRFGEYVSRWFVVGGATGGFVRSYGGGVYPDGGQLNENIPYALAVTLEVGENVNIDVYQEISVRLRQVVQIPAGAA